MVYTKTIMLIMVNKMMTLISSAKSMYMYMLKLKKIETLLRFDFDIKDVLKHLLFSGYGMILVGLNSYSV